MFSKLKRPKTLREMSDTGLVSVLPASQLLVDPDRYNHIHKLRKLVRLPDSQFETYYTETIHQFAEFVQRLPLTSKGRFASQGGMLDAALERGQEAVMEYNNYLRSIDAYPQNVNQQHELWNFVVFSAALFLHISQAVLHYKVTLYDDNHRAIKLWSPYSGAMFPGAAFYKHEVGDAHNVDLKSQVTPMIATRLIAPDGFAWIARQPEVMEMWLNLLKGEEGSAGGRGFLLQLIMWIDARVLARISKGTHLFGGDKKDSLFSKGEKEHTHIGDETFKDVLAGKVAVSDKLSDLNKEKGDHAGNFVEWLRDGLKDGSVSHNTDKSSVQVVKEGVLLVSPQVFKDFIKSSGADVSVSTLQAHVTQLGVTSPSSLGSQMHQYNVINQQGANSHVQGVVVAQAEVLFAKGVNPQLNQAFKVQSPMMQETNAAEARAPTSTSSWRG